MSINILMPALSPTMTEGNLVKWHKQEGDSIKSGDLLAEIETDKATMEVEAVDAGTLGKIVIPEGSENVQVNAVIAVLLEKGETLSDIKIDQPSQEAQPACESAVMKDPIKTAQKPLEELSVNPQDNTKNSSNNDFVNAQKPQTNASNQDRIIASPLAKRLAGQNNVSLNNIQGTGPRDRIIKADVMKNINQPRGHNTVQQNSPTEPYPEPPFHTLKLSNVRKIIAQRLTESKQTVPHFYLTADCQMDALLKVREDINAQLTQDQKISVNDFIIKALAQALNDVPQANASWGEDHIKYYERIDVAVAVAIEGGLITPVLFDAFNKPLSVISSEMKSLAARARNNKLKPHEFQGGSISLSNLGMYGVKNFSAIINPPQACILAVGRAMKQPVIEDNQIKIGTVMSCTLSVDHRVVDGAVGATYLKAFQSYIESPVKLFYS